MNKKKPSKNNVNEYYFDKILSREKTKWKIKMNGKELKYFNKIINTNEESKIIYEKVKTQSHIYNEKKHAKRILNNVDNNNEINM